MLIASLCALAWRSARAQAPDLVITPSATLAPIAASDVLKPAGMAYDSAGNLYVADARGHVIRRLSTTGTWTTVAGDGRQGFAGDGGPAISAELDTPMGIAVSAEGTLWIADAHNHRVRLVSPNGIISTIAGSSGSGTVLRQPVALAFDVDGALYIADAADHRIRRVDENGSISTVAGTGDQGYSGDEGPAILARIDSPSSLAFDAAGRLLFADRRNHRIRRVDVDGTVHTVAGDGSASGEGDGMAVHTPLAMPRGVSVDADGNLFVADTKSQRILVVEDNGAVGIAVGNGEQAASIAQGSVRDVALNAPRSIALNQAGVMAIGGDASNHLSMASAAPMDFGTVIVGSSSPSQTLAFMNRGDAQLRLDAVTTPNGFDVTDVSCGAFPVAIASGGRCVMSIVFHPGSSGGYVGKIVVTGNVPAQTIAVAGLGSASQGSLVSTTTTLDAGGTVVYTNAPISLTAQVLAADAGAPTGIITFYDGQTPLSIVKVVNGSAVYRGTALTAGVHLLSAVYNGDATYAGSRSVVINVTASVAADFSLALATGSIDGSSQTITAGQSALYQLTLTPLNGAFTQLVTLSATGLPAGAVASFDPPTLVPGSAPSTILLTVKTVAHTARFAAGGAVVAFCFGFAFLRLKRKRRIFPLALASLLFAVGCGGGYRSGTGDTTSSAGVPYAITITATAPGTNGAAVVHSIVVTLIVR
ncbi:Ig-like domain repeat protein [Terriglobus saanensis]|nr:Ig-like domain repeat protein [Terriglobus saanensis]